MQTNRFPTPSKPRIGLIGDTHADRKSTLPVIERFVQMDVDVVVQLGDFGWWPQLSFAGDVAHYAAASGINVCFIDGNHEHHRDLRRSANRCRPDRRPTEPVQMLDGLWYLPRGCAWEWHGVKFRGLGGAFSIDYLQRRPGVSWFPDEEEPTREETRMAIAAGPADVLLSHDHPALGYHLPGIPDVPDWMDQMSQQTRLKLLEVVKAIKPRLVVHGHWHHAYTKRVNGLSVVGLADNESPAREAAAILDLETLKTEPLHLT